MTATNRKKKFLQLNLLNYTQKANKEEIHPFLEKLKNKNSHEKGELFERFVIAYLRKVPPHKDIFVKVWRWKDYPQRGNRLVYCSPKMILEGQYKHKYQGYSRVYGVYLWSENIC